MMMHPPPGEPEWFINPDRDLHAEWRGLQLWVWYDPTGLCPFGWAVALRNGRIITQSYGGTLEHAKRRAIGEADRLIASGRNFKAEEMSRLDD